MPLDPKMLIQVIHEATSEAVTSVEGETVRFMEGLAKNAVAQAMAGSFRDRINLLDLALTHSAQCNLEDIKREILAEHDEAIAPPGMTPELEAEFDRLEAMYARDRPPVVASQLEHALTACQCGAFAHVRPALITLEFIEGKLEWEWFGGA